MAFTEWRWLTWPISWAMTTANCASSPSRARSPRVMNTSPPGSAKALGTEEFSSVKR